MRNLAIALLLSIVGLAAAPGARAQSSHGATVSWNYVQGSDLAVGFFVFRSTTNGQQGAALNATALALTQLSYFDPTGAGGTTYCYEVTAVDILGLQSPPSAQQCATAIGGNPLSPVNVSVVEK